MIGAICLKLDNKYKVKLYLVDTHGLIDWDSKPIPRPELGNNIYSYEYLSVQEKPAVLIAQGLDGNYILRLIETKRYILKIENDDGDNNVLLNYRNRGIKLLHFQNEGNKLLKLEWDSDSVVFQFVNYLGRSKITFEDDFPSFIFEVIPDKIDYEDDYISLTEAIADECAELLLDYAGPTSNIYSQTETDNKTLLEQFIFLRKFCYKDNLLGLFEMIKRNPDRVLDQEDEIKPFGSGVPSQKYYTNPFSYSKGWISTDEKTLDHTIYIPQMVAVTRKFDRLDTPANRFVKFALQRFDHICSALSENLPFDTNAVQSECLKEAKVVHELLEDIFRDAFFDDIGDLDIMPQNNQVLQKREGYSQIFSAYSMLDLALQLDWEGKDEIYEGESKNVALLYEYWLFFELYKIIKSIDGCIVAKTDKNPFFDFGDGNKITISLYAGKDSCQSFDIEPYGVKINLYYNRTFSREPFSSTNYQGSYSRPFRPDYTLSIFPRNYTGELNGEKAAIADGAVSFIHFDAKYRITDLTGLFGNDETASESEVITEDKIGSVVATYKCGDLLKMHTYNDAVRRTVGSYVLYPGSNGENILNNETFTLYEEILPGVGAFSIKPSINEQGEKELRRFLLQVLDIGKKEYSRFNRLRQYAEELIHYSPY